MLVTIINWLLIYQFGKSIACFIRLHFIYPFGKALYVMVNLVANKNTLRCCFHQMSEVTSSYTCRVCGC